MIWPEHHERRVLLDAALKRRAGFNLDLRPGDGFAMLPEIASAIPADSILCVYHTHVANQIPGETRDNFLDEIGNLGARRDVIYLFNNIKPGLHLSTYRDGKPMFDRMLANVDGHARWIEWAHGHPLAQPGLRRPELYPPRTPRGD